MFFSFLKSLFILIFIFALTAPAIYSVITGQYLVAIIAIFATAVINTEIQYILDKANKVLNKTNK